MLQVLRVPTMNQMCVNTNREVRYTFSVVLIAPHALRALAFVSMVQTNIEILHVPRAFGGLYRVPPVPRQAHAAITSSQSWSCEAALMVVGLGFRVLGFWGLGFF